MYWSRFFWITKDRKSLNWLSQRRNLLAHITGKGNDSDKAGPGRSHAKMNNLSLWSYLLPVADSSPLMTVMVKYRSMSTCHHLIHSTRKYECLFSKNSSKRLSWALLVHMPAPGSLQLSPRSWNGCCACPSALQAAGKAECNCERCRAPADDHKALALRWASLLLCCWAWASSARWKGCILETSWGCEPVDGEWGGWASGSGAVCLPRENGPWAMTCVRWILRRLAITPILLVQFWSLVL